MGKKFNEILIGLRKSSGLTQAEFAKKEDGSRYEKCIYGNLFRRERKSR